MDMQEYVDGLNFPFIHEGAHYVSQSLDSLSEALFLPGRGHIEKALTCVPEAMRYQLDFDLACVNGIAVTRRAPLLRLTYPAPNRAGKAYPVYFASRFKGEPYPVFDQEVFPDAMQDLQALQHGLFAFLKDERTKVYLRFLQKSLLVGEANLCRPVTSKP